MLKIRKVVVGLSGGVDSAVTALLLKNKGFDIHAVFMQNWDIADEQGQCSADKDYKDAAIVCDKLGIKLHHVNFVKYYWNDVFSNLIKEYETGSTPNPDILCNRHIKFDQFIHYAREYLNADAIATGHYARTSFGPYLEYYQPNTKVKLLRAACIHKDQTFFLSQVHEESLRKVMFPLGELMKVEVKQLAQDNGLFNVATKKESMGICFIGTRDFKTFISEYIDDKPGKFIDIETNKQVGEHQGVHHWTVGQRSNLPNYTKPAYIARKVLKNNNIFVAQGWHHSALFSDLFITGRAHWIHSKPTDLANNGVLECEFKFQHVQVLQTCTLCESKNGLVVNLNCPIRALTTGQYAVFYRDNECLGSARILHPGPCQYFYLKYIVKKKSHNTSDPTENLTENCLESNVCLEENADENRDVRIEARNVQCF